MVDLISLHTSTKLQTDLLWAIFLESETPWNADSEQRDGQSS